jgi:D-alanyl-D-alanine carboxypeptidase/D-alanyl-D-alanine-endopeptidase (penicillin-binding protein 4)
VTLTNPRFPISARGAIAAALLVVGSLAPLAARRADANVAVPRPRATAPAATTLAERIDSILRRPALRQAQWGIEMRDAASGRVLYAHNAERHFIPASNLKLVVSAAAAHHLPADFRFRTSLYGTGPVVDGTLRGDLVLYGRGDPMISNRYFPTRTAVWEMLADSLRARGITRVSGAVVADESWFDTEYVRGDWETYDTRWWYGAPVSALGFNDNSIDFRVEGAAGRPRITWEPQSSYVVLENAATTAAGRATIDFERAGNGVRAYGTLPAAAPAQREHFAVANAARYAGTTFRETLERRGIDVATDEVRVVSDPARSPARGATALAEHRSPPLAQAIGPILLNSQNWFAEQLLKTLGREVSGAGSWDAGIAVERAFLTSVVGIDSADVVLRDGSGLSAGNLVTPRSLVQLLAYVRRTPRQSVVRDALPVSGGKGSLSTRFTDLPGRVRAKTGYIGNVDSLSGYLTLADGREVIFAIIANGSGQPSSRMKAGIDDIVRAATR